MPNRYNSGSDRSNFPERNPYPSHIKNTDNESTQYIPRNSDNENTAELRALSGNEPRRQSQYGTQGTTPGRRQYYGSQEQQQYGGSQNRQYSSNRQQQYNGYQNGQYNTTGQQQYDRYQNGRYDQQPQRRQYEGGYYEGNSQSGRRNPPPNRSADGRRPANGGSPKKKRPQTPPPPQKRRQQTSSPRPRRRKHHFILKLFIILLILVGIIFGVYSCTALSMIKKLNYQEDGDRSRSAGALSADYVTSVLLIGTDGRSLDDRGRSDTMILLSINKETDEITLTSFMRDSYVDIPNYGWEKLNAAYSYGGAELLMDTIEKNFSVRIDNYISVNFNSFASIIDAVGGIEIEVSDDEAQEINTILMAEVNELMGDAVDSDLLSGGGKLHLSGKQALSYARIRYIGNADFERTERQRNVLTQVASKLKTLNPSMISKIAKNAVPQVTTNMTTEELYLLSLRLPFVVRYDIEQIRIPADGTYGNVTTSSGGAALSVDFDTNYNIIKEEVFGE